MLHIGGVILGMLCVICCALCVMLLGFWVSKG